jgi:hypothetical protein
MIKKGVSEAKKFLIGNNGYESINLFKNKRGNTLLVHRLMALSFFKNFNNELHVHHKDSDRVNNNLSNLEIVTHQQNMDYLNSKESGGIVSKNLIIKKFKSKKWESVEEFFRELIKI